MTSSCSQGRCGELPLVLSGPLCLASRHFMLANASSSQMEALIRCTSQMEALIRWQQFLWWQKQLGLGPHS